MGLFDILFGNGKKNGSVKVRKPAVDPDLRQDWSLIRTREELLAQMKDMVQRNFPEYDVSYDLAAYHLKSDCHPACTPIQFLFQKDGKNLLAVVVVNRNNYKGMNVIGTKMICEDLGIPYIRFYEEYPNKEEYVVERIRQYLL